MKKNIIITTTSVTDKDYDKYVKKSVKLIKSSEAFNNKKDIAGISNMYAMDMARDKHGALGKAYEMGMKKYKTVILKKVNTLLKKVSND